MKKKLELSTPNSCLNKAAAEEPVFVLRGNDPLAAMTVRHWAAMAAGTHESEKIIEAKKLADEMDDWRKKDGKFKVTITVNAAEISSRCTKLHWESDILDAIRGLLAVVHGDGGHHTEAVGLRLSALNAIERIRVERANAAINNPETVEGLQRIIAEMAKNMGKLVDENTRLHHELEREQFSFAQADSRIPLHLGDFGEVSPLPERRVSESLQRDLERTPEDLERRNELGRQFTKAFARINGGKAEPTLINNCAKELFDLELQHSSSCLSGTALLLHTLADQDNELEQLKKERNQAESDAKVRRQMLDNQKRHIGLLTEEKHQLQREREALETLKNHVDCQAVRIQRVYDGCYTVQYGGTQVASSTFIEALDLLRGVI